LTVINLHTYFIALPVNLTVVATKTIKMWDTLKEYALTANDRKNFTVKQLQILFHHFKQHMQPLSADFDRLTIMTGLQRNQIIKRFRNHHTAYYRVIRSRNE